MPDTYNDTKITVRISSPLHEITLAEADSVLLPATMGNILILPKRAPLFLQLKCGKVILKNNGEKKIFYISSGLSEIRHNLCPICAWAIEEGKTTLAAAREHIQSLQQELTTVHTPLQKQQIQRRLDLWQLIATEKK